MKTYLKAIVVGAVLTSTGCHTDILLKVDAPKDLNGERPVRMLVRAVERSEFVSDSYQQVSDKVVSRDDSVLLSQPIYPGYVNVAQVKKPMTKSVAVYFFFTSPGAQWKTLLETPLPYWARIRLASDAISQVQPNR